MDPKVRKIFKRGLIFVDVFLVVVLVITFALTFLVEKNDLEITCNYGNKDTFLASEEYVLFFTYDHSMSGFPDYTQETLAERCELTWEDIANVAKELLSGNREVDDLYSVEKISSKDPVLTYAFRTFVSLIALVFSPFA